VTVPTLIQTRDSECFGPGHAESPGPRSLQAAVAPKVFGAQSRGPSSSRSPQVCRKMRMAGAKMVDLGGRRMGLCTGRASELIRNNSR